MDNTVYLFPLPHSVLFKKVTLPFHIFEIRYRQMVHDAIERGIPIAVTPHNVKNEYKNEICVAGTPHIITTYPDGRLDIFITGAVKCHLTNFIMEAPYLVYDYRPLEEKMDFDETTELDLDSMKSLLERWAHHYLADEDQRASFAATLEDPEVLVNYCTVFLVEDLKTKRAVMEAMSAKEKIRLVLSMIGPKEISLGPFMPILKF